AYIVKCFDRIFHAPASHGVGVPVVIDVILVFIRTGDSKHNILLPGLTPVNPLAPEPCYADQNFKSVLTQILLVAGITYIIVNGKGNGTVSVDLFESDLPLIMAFFSIDGYHRIQGCSIFKAKL